MQLRANISEVSLPEVGWLPRTMAGVRAVACCSPGASLSGLKDRSWKEEFLCRWILGLLSSRLLDFPAFVLKKV